MLLVGLPGTGKTTALRRVAARLASQRVGGFVTEEIRVRGERRGFRGITFDGFVRDIARADRPGPPRVGKYGVAVAAVDQVVSQAFAPADVYLVDEVGRMECLFAAFVAAMRRLLAGPTPVVATVAARGGGFIDEVKAWPDAVLVHTTRLDPPHTGDRRPSRPKLLSRCTLSESPCCAGC